MNEKFWLDARRLQTRFGVLGSGLINLTVLVCFFAVFWTLVMNPKGYLRMYTPMYGYAYEQWFLIAVLLTALIFRFWPLSHSFMEKQHPLIKGAVLYGINLLFVLFMVNFIFRTVIGNMGVPYFSEDRLLALKINPYNSREYASQAILMVGAMAALVIPIWSLHLYNWPERKIEGGSAKITSFLLVMFFVFAAFFLVLHPHFGIIFYPWQIYTAAFPWWERLTNTLSGTFNLGWMMAWTSAIWFIQVTWEGYPIKFVTRQPYRALTGFFFTLFVGLIFFVGFHFLQDVVWGPPIRGGKLINAVDWRYLHSGETAMFLLVVALVLGIHFNNWPNRYATEVNILIRTVIIGIGTLAFYTFYYKFSNQLLGTQPGYSHPQQYPLAPLSIFIAFLLTHTWYLDKWPGEKVVRTEPEAGT